MTSNTPVATKTAPLTLDEIVKLSVQIGHQSSDSNDLVFKVYDVIGEITLYLRRSQLELSESIQARFFVHDLQKLVENNCKQDQLKRLAQKIGLYVQRLQIACNPSLQKRAYEFASTDKSPFSIERLTEAELKAYAKSPKELSKSQVELLFERAVSDWNLSVINNLLLRCPFTAEMLDKVVQKSFEMREFSQIAKVIILFHFNVLSDKAKREITDWVELVLQIRAPIHKRGVEEDATFSSFKIDSLMSVEPRLAALLNKAKPIEDKAVEEDATFSSFEIVSLMSVETRLAALLNKAKPIENIEQYLPFEGISRISELFNVANNVPYWNSARAYWMEAIAHLQQNDFIGFRGAVEMVEGNLNNILDEEEKFSVQDYYEKLMKFASEGEVAGLRRNLDRTHFSYLSAAQKEDILNVALSTPFTIKELLLENRVDVDLILLFNFTKKVAQSKNWEGLSRLINCRILPKFTPGQFRELRAQTEGCPKYIQDALIIEDNYRSQKIPIIDNYF